MFVPTEGAIVDDRFRLVREIGRGGMGAVWECFDDQLQAPCALKFILDSFATNEQLRARFLREARAIARLQSPHAVSVWSVGEWDGALFIAMELLRGESLQDRLDREQRLDAASVLAIVEQVSMVLGRAHELGIVHRDLKPDNLWLWEGPRLFVKVLDFGIAKHASDTDGLRTASGVMMGTPYFMSPEQAAGNRAVDHRSDLWSLAVIVTVCLTGNRPFESSGIGDLLLQIIDKPVPSLASLGLPASSDLQAWWATATARNPEHRFQSAAAMCRALEQALGGNAAGVGPDNHSPSAMMGPDDAARAPAASDPNASPAFPSSPAASTVEPLSHTRPETPASRRTSWYWGIGLTAIAIGIATYLLTSGSPPETPSDELEAAASSTSLEALSDDGATAPASQPIDRSGQPSTDSPADVPAPDPEPAPEASSSPPEEVQNPPDTERQRSAPPPQSAPSVAAPIVEKQPPRVVAPAPRPRPAAPRQPRTAEDRVGF